MGIQIFKITNINLRCADIFLFDKIGIPKPYVCHANSSQNAFGFLYPSCQHIALALQALEMKQVLLSHACGHGHSIPGYSSHHKAFWLMMVADWQASCHHKCRWTYLQPAHEGTLLGYQKVSFSKWDHIFLSYPEATFLLCCCAWHVGSWGFDLWWVNPKNLVEAFWNFSWLGESREGWGKEASRNIFQDSWLLEKLVKLCESCGDKLNATHRKLGFGCSCCLYLSTLAVFSCWRRNILFLCIWIITNKDQFAPLQLAIFLKHWHNS